MKRTLTSMLLGLAMMALTGCNISGLVLSGDDAVRGLASLVSGAGGADGTGLGGGVFQPGDGTDEGIPDGRSGDPAGFCTVITRGDCQ